MGSFYVLIPIVFKHSWMSGFIGAYTKEALQWPYWGVYRVSLAMALLGRIQSKSRNGLIEACTEEASQWPFAVYTEEASRTAPLCGEAFIYRKIELWLFKDKKKY